MKINAEAITKSMEFYRNYDLNICIRDYALTLNFKNELLLSYEGIIEWFKTDYVTHVESNFDMSILFAEDVLQFAFDESKNILPLDNIIYQKLRLCAAKCRVLDFEEKMRLIEK